MATAPQPLLGIAVLTSGGALPAPELELELEPHAESDAATAIHAMEQTAAVNLVLLNCADI